MSQLNKFDKVESPTSYTARNVWSSQGRSSSEICAETIVEYFTCNSANPFIFPRANDELLQQLKDKSELIGHLISELDQLRLKLSEPLNEGPGLEGSLCERSPTGTAECLISKIVETTEMLTQSRLQAEADRLTINQLETTVINLKTELSASTEETKQQKQQLLELQQKLDQSEISAASDKSGLIEAKAEHAKLRKNVAKYRRNINTLQIQLAEERSLADTSQHKSATETDDLKQQIATLEAVNRDLSAKCVGYEIAQKISVAKIKETEELLTMLSLAK